MEFPIEQMVDMYLRNCLSLFSAKDFERTLKKMGIRTDITECEFFLDTNPEVFSLTNGMYITRAGIFTGKVFSIKPTRKELEKGVFAAGHRCMPFVDPEELPQFVHFYFNGKELPKKVVEFDSGAAESFFFLAGEEFSPQFIMADPANEGMIITDTDAVLPPVVNLTCVDISELIKESGFRMGDRLLCKVTDWDASIVEIMPLMHGNTHGGMQMRQEDVERQQWYKNLEDALLSSFERAGPCGSIEEQLALVFLENSRSLCVPECGSVEECIIQSDTVGLEQYGIETRIWRYGQDVPAIGSWNNFQTPQQEEKHEIEYTSADFYVADYLIDAFVKNEFAKKRYNAENVLAGIIPEEFELPEKDMRNLQERVVSHYAMIEKSYNHFADFSIVPVREQALSLYVKVAALIYKIDCAKAELEDYPQQELVTISQIYSHVLRIIEHVELEPDVAEEEREELLMSIDGMLYNYDCIYDQIIDIINKSKKNEFRAGI